MIFTEGPKEPFMPAYKDGFDPKVAYAIGNRNIGLMFGQRLRASMLWKMNGYVSDHIILMDDADTEYFLTTVPGLKELSFTFDNMGYPILAVQDPEGIKVYRFTGYGGDEETKVLLLELPGCRNPKLIPTSVSDLGSIYNQPVLVYIDDVGDVLTRSYKDHFKTILSEVVSGLMATDELREAGITRTGKVQIEISKIKETP